MRSKFLAAACMALFLNACSSEDGGGGANPPPAGQGFCNLAIGGGNAGVTVTTSGGCLGCDVADKDKAIDNSDASYASMNFPNGATGNISVLAKAQPGIVFPEGSRVAVRLNFQNAHSGTIAVNTYLSGVLQDQTTESNGIAYMNNTSTATYGFTAGRTFDAVEIAISDSQTGKAREMRIREICADE